MDPIANLLTTLKNASIAGKTSVSVPFSKMKYEIAEILLKKGFVSSVSKKGKKTKFLEVTLTYNQGEPVIRDVKRISKSSRRLYMKAKEIHPYKSGFGMSVLSTPKGILSDMDAKKEKVGGEILFSIW